MYKGGFGIGLNFGKMRMDVSDKMRRIMIFFLDIAWGVTFSCTHSDSVTEECYTDVCRLDFDLSKRCENVFVV